MHNYFFGRTLVAVAFVWLWPTLEEMMAIIRGGLPLRFCCRVCFLYFVVLHNHFRDQYPRRMIHEMRKMKMPSAGMIEEPHDDIPW